MADNNNFIKEWMMGVATALSVATLGIAISLYTDVQVLKSKQEQNSNLSSAVASLEKQVALTTQALDALKDTLQELKKRDRT